jgi:hypothetical protein
LNKLIRLDCSNCPLLINIPIVEKTTKYNCKWVNPSNTQLNQLIRSQKIVKKYLNRKKFIIRLVLIKYLPLVLINIIEKY